MMEIYVDGQTLKICFYHQLQSVHLNALSQIH